MRTSYDPALAPFTPHDRLTLGLAVYALADRLGGLGVDEVADLAAATCAAAIVDLGLLTAAEVEALPEVGADLVVDALAQAVALRAAQLAEGRP